MIFSLSRQWSSVYGFRFADSGRVSMGCGGIAPRQQFIKNQTPQKVTQNRKNPTPWRPKLDFGVIFAPFSLPFLLPFRKTSIF